MALHEKANLTIDLEAIAANYRFFCELAGSARTAAVVKANGYGCGAIEVSNRLVAEGCDLLFVAQLDEAIQLREAATIPSSVDICVFSGVPKNAEDYFQNKQLVPIFNSLDQLQKWADYCRQEQRLLPAVPFFDTGLNRLGMPKDEVMNLISDPDQMADFATSFYMTHLACADEPKNEMNNNQLEQFLGLIGQLPAAPLSISNSAGCLLGGRYIQNITRPGYGLYGGQPSQVPTPEIKPVVTLKAPILQVRSVSPGETTGYGATKRFDLPARVATIGVGYADGVLRHLSNSGAGFIEDFKVPIAGRVSMDLISFDVTAVPDSLVQPGAEIELIGPHQTIDELGGSAGTLGYEILTSLGNRYRRIYV